MHSSRLPLRYFESLKGIQLRSIQEEMCHSSTLRILLCKKGFFASAGQDAEASVTVGVWQTLENNIWESHLADRPEQLHLKSYALFTLAVREERNGICGAGSGGGPTVRWGCSGRQEWSCSTESHSSALWETDKCKSSLKLKWGLGGRVWELLAHKLHAEVGETHTEPRGIPHSQQTLNRRMSCLPSGRKGAGKLSHENFKLRQWEQHSFHRLFN